MKITPAHDFNDFEVGKRHDLPQISVLDVEGKLTLSDNEAFLAGVPKSTPTSTRRMKLHGVDRFKARKIVIERLETAGLDRQDRAAHAHGAARRPLQRGDRAVPHRPVVRQRQGAGGRRHRRGARGQDQFVPKNWEKTYFDWMENIQPWCISRQLWWGHQIPAWYGPDGKVFVAETEDEAVSRALAYYTETGAISDAQARNMATHPGKREPFLTRDEDVLDTWFSSALWPFSTLGWPDDDAGGEALLSDRGAGHRLRHHLLLGRPHDDDGPALHERGAVQATSTSTVSSATRRAPRCRSRRATSSIRSASSTTTAPMRCASRSRAARRRATTSGCRRRRVESNRNFATKLWNAARFVEFNGAGRVAGFDPKSRRRRR